MKKAIFDHSCYVLLRFTKVANYHNPCSAICSLRRVNYELLRKKRVATFLVTEEDMNAEKTRAPPLDSLSRTEKNLHLHNQIHLLTIIPSL